MKTKDIFTLIVRVLGVVIFLYGLEALLQGLLETLSLSDPKYAAPKYWAVKGVVEIIFGLLVMRGTIPIADLAFPEQTPEQRETEETVEDKKRDV